MFALHDRVRRRICVAGFILLCVVPTVAVLAWAAAWSLPWHVRAEARRIGRQLGMEITLARVEHLRPGAVRLGGVVLRDCEEPGAVLRCDAVDAELKTLKDKTGATRRVLVLRTATAEVNADRLPAIGKLTRRLLELRAGNLDLDVWCAAGTIDLRSTGPAEHLSDVRGTVQTIESGTEAQLQFSLSDQKSTRPVRLALGRNRQVRPPEDWFALDTGGAALPCALVGRGIPAMRSLGEEARFRGYLSAKRTSSGWDGQVRPLTEGSPACMFSDVELDRLVTDRFPHTLSGKAQVVVTWVSFRSGRIEKAFGGVSSAGPGAVSPSLLAVAAEYLGLEQASESPPGSDPVSYDGLAFQFALDKDGLTIKQWWDNRRGVMIARGRPLLVPTGRTCPAVALVQAMAPGASVQVPATQQTDVLLRHLPLPEVVPAAAVLGHSRLATEPEPAGQPR